MTYRQSWLSRVLVWLAFKLRVVGPKNWFRTRRIVPNDMSRLVYLAEHAPEVLPPLTDPVVETKEGT